MVAKNGALSNGGCGNRREVGLPPLFYARGDEKMF
jgi:hypothetical protein